MKKQRIKKIVKYKASALPIDTKTDWKRVDAMSDQEREETAREDLDSLLADENFWKVAQLVIPTENGKERITIRIDSDVLNWLKHEGRGYQSRINAILRAFMNFKEKDHEHYPIKGLTKKKHHDHSSHHKHAHK